KKDYTLLKEDPAPRRDGELYPHRQQIKTNFLEEKARYSLRGIPANLQVTFWEASSFQKVLDSECSTHGATGSRNGHFRFAGRSSGCFLSSDLNFTHIGMYCVDNCGRLVICGGFPGFSRSYRTINLPLKIQEHAPTLCENSRLQHQLNLRCGEGKLLRLVADTWKCVLSSGVTFDASKRSICLNDCGEKVECLGNPIDTSTATPLDIEA
ncbi:microneme protein MIC1, partial [Cardiosporidium cionae]